MSKRRIELSQINVNGVSLDLVFKLWQRSNLEYRT